ncbi:MAG: sodium-dependent transporter [Phycisphaerales bacterium]
MMNAEAARPLWSSRLMFLMATIGAAVGLGNIWKFPYTAGVSGGGAFVICYIGAIAGVALPVLVAELMIGRRGRRGPVGSITAVAAQSGARSAWRAIGWLNVVAVFVILSFYSVIAGWALAYLPKFASGAFRGADAGAVDASFRRLLDAPVEMMLWHGAFILITAVVVARGLDRGIERAVGALMPALFAMLLLLVLYAGIVGDFAAAARFLFMPDFTRLSSEVLLSAVGQAFFSASVAMGLTIAYGSYMRTQDGIVNAAAVVIVADTLVAIVAGLAIFPLVFANDLDPAEGPGLIFMTLPLAFAQMPAGSAFGALFFLLLIFAALTSSIAIIETVISPLTEGLGLKRMTATCLVSVAAWLLGLVTVLSFNVWSDVHPLAFFDRFAGKTPFDLLDYAATNVMLPLGGVLIALFAGWAVSRAEARDELRRASPAIFGAWRILIRFLVPLLLAAVLISGL